MAGELRDLAIDPWAARADHQGPEPEAPDPASEVLLGLSRLIEQLGRRLDLDLAGRDPGEIAGRLRLLAQLFGKGSTTDLLADLDSPSTRDRIATFLRPLPWGAGFALPTDPGRIAEIWLRLVNRVGPGLRAWLARELSGDAARRLEEELATLAGTLGLADSADLLDPVTWARNPLARTAALGALVRLVPAEVLLRVVEDALALASLDESVPPERLAPYLARLGQAIGADLLGSARAPLAERLRLLVTFLRAGTLEGLVDLVRDDPATRELVRVLLTDPETGPAAGPGATAATRPADQAPSRAGGAVAATARPTGTLATEREGALVQQLGAVLGLAPLTLARLDGPGLERSLAGLASLRGFTGPEQLLAAAAAQPELREALRELVRALAGGPLDGLAVPPADGAGGRSQPQPGATAAALAAAPTAAALALRETAAALVGIPLALHDPALLERELAGLAGLRGFAGPGHLLAAAQEQPALRDVLRELLAGGPRRLFEEPARFRLIAGGLPGRAAGGSTHPTRIWNAACGSGLDACTLAIAAGEADPPLTVRILATDEPGAPLEAARRAVYPSSVLGPFGPERTRRWFRPHGQDLELAPDARALIEVRARHLLDSAPGTDFAAVVSHRRLPAFTPQAIAVAFERFADALLVGGWLLVDEELELPAAVADRFRQLAPGQFERA